MTLEQFLPPVVVEIKAYAARKPEEFVKRVVEAFALSSLVHCERLIAFLPPSQQEIRHNWHRDTLTLGDHKYYRNTETPHNASYLEEEVTNDKPVCHVCTEPLESKPIFTDSRNTIGIYYCGQCAQSILNDDEKQQISEVTCPICMDSEDKMVILSCMHALCSDCIAQLISRNVKTCPTCRTQSLGNPRVKVSVQFVIDRYFAERLCD